MAELRIPEEYERGFVAIRALNEEQVQDLVLAFEGEPPTLSRADLRARIGSRVNTVTRGDLDRVVETLVSLYALRDSMVLETSDFADVICEAMDESGVEELEFDDDEDRGLFKTRLVQLLGMNSLDISAKANDLLYEHEHTAHSPMRVLTDIRPIFGTDPESDPEGAVIVHTLKINYHEGRRVKEFFISLDTEQIDELISALERANLKAESLKRMLAGTNVPYIEAE